MSSEIGHFEDSETIIQAKYTLPKINLYHLTLTQEHLILFVSKQIKKSFSIKYPHKVKSATKTENLKKTDFFYINQ